MTMMGLIFSKRYFLLWSLIFISSISSAQFKFVFFAEPDSATLYVNGEKAGITPCIERFYWGKNIDGKIVFTLEKEGFKTWSDTLKEKPEYFDKKYFAHLEHAVPNYSFEQTAAPVAFEKLLTDELKENQVIGKIEQEKRYNEEVLWHSYYTREFKDFDNYFNQTLKEAGFPTVSGETKQGLFETSERVIPVHARYLVGAELKDVQVVLKSEKSKVKRNAYEVSKQVSVDVLWKIFDKKAGKVVDEYRNKGKFSGRNSRRTYDFTLREALDHSLMDFLRNSSLSELVRNNTFEADSSFLAPISAEVQYQLNAPVPPDFEDLSSMIKYVSPACVTVLTNRGHGSGVLIDESGLILSAYHVVEDAKNVEVKLNNGLVLKADVLVYENRSDVVLLKVVGKGFTSLRTGSTEALPLGEDILTIGTPSRPDLGQSIAKGIVSGRRLADDIKYIQLDMAVSPGNSGGPLLNNKGEILGIVQSKIVDEGVEGIGFAIPVEEALKRLNIGATLAN